jgi:mRNA interferase HigB
VSAALSVRRHRIAKVLARSASDIRRDYATGSVVSAERIVFNIKGNSYRLVVSVDFEKSIVWTKWVGTYRDYDRIDVTKVKREK